MCVCACFFCKEYQRMCICVCIYIYTHIPSGQLVSIQVLRFCNSTQLTLRSWLVYHPVATGQGHDGQTSGSLAAETEKMLTTFDRESCEIKKTSLRHSKNESTQEPTTINNPYLETQGENSPQGPLTYTQSNSCTAKWSNFVI